MTSRAPTASLPTQFGQLVMIDSCTGSPPSGPPSTRRSTPRRRETGCSVRASALHCAGRQPRLPPRTALQHLSTAHEGMFSADQATQQHDTASHKVLASSTGSVTCNAGRTALNFGVLRHAGSPMPLPMHMETMPKRADLPRRAISCSSVAVARAPGNKTPLFTPGQAGGGGTRHASKRIRQP